MPSMKDVASMAGVSISTVSRVINQTIPVDEQTRSKVLDAIETLNYRPNLLAKGLRVKSGQLIGLILPEIRLHAFVQIINSVEEYVVNRGFSLIIGNTHNDPDIEEKLLDNLLRRNVDGIIFSRLSDESRVLNLIKKSRVKVVAIDRELDVQDVPHVILDNYGAGVMAANHLISLGHKNIACITGPLNIKLCRERLAGFSDTIKKEHLPFEDNQIYEGRFDFDSGFNGAEHFLSQNSGITAFWAQNDLMAIGALKTLKTHLLNVPDEIAIMGMDNLEISRMVAPALTTIMQPFDEMSKKAVEILFDGESESEPQRIILQPGLIVRDSTVLKESRI